MRERAAEILGICRKTLRKTLKQLGLEQASSDSPPLRTAPTAPSALTEESIEDGEGFAGPTVVAPDLGRDGFRRGTALRETSLGVGRCPAGFGIGSKDASGGGPSRPSRSR